MLGFGIEDYIMARSSKHINPFRTTFWFQVIDLFILIILAAFFFNYSPISVPYLVLLVIAGVIGAGALFSFNKGLREGNVSVVAPISSGWGAVTAILGVLFLSEALTTVQLLCIAVIVIGTILTSFEMKDVRRIWESKKPLGLKYALIALFGWGVWYFMVGILVKGLGWFPASLYLVILNVVIMGLYGVFTKEKFAVKKEDAPRLLVIAVLGAAGFLAYNIGITYYFAAIVAPITAAAPALTVILALLLLKEKIASNQKLGIILIVLGLVALSI